MALNLAIQRLYSQQLLNPKTRFPEDVVRWFGAVQSQDFAAAKWAVGQRTLDVTDADLEGAFARGSILRTHLMRPTWHFVLPDDIRWILELTAPRVKKALSSNYKMLELDAGQFAVSNDVFRNALQGGNYLLRTELAAVLKKSGINPEGLRMNHILIEAELDQVICSGPKLGKQFTYALFEERVPNARILEHDESLAELARRYFSSHGPALLKDFIWWSGLSAIDAQNALDSISSDLGSEVIDGKTYWFSGTGPATEDFSQVAALLPNFDEFTVGYADRSAIYEPQQLEHFERRGDVLNNILILNGCLAGTWKRTVRGREVVLDLQPFQSLSESDWRSIADVIKRYSGFLGLPIRSIQ